MEKQFNRAVSAEKKLNLARKAGDLIILRAAGLYQRPEICNKAKQLGHVCVAAARE